MGNNSFASHVTEHLKMVQGVINRLASNAFIIKGWSLSICAAILAWSANKDSSQATSWIILAALIPIIFFWALDAYYLHLERQYRALYKQVQQQALNPQQQVIVEPFSMDTAAIQQQSDSLAKTLLRTSIIGFHVPLLLTVVICLWVLNR